jgi:hypothetical protein
MAEQDLTQRFAEQAVLIGTLKNALVQRDLRIGQLELLLSKALVSENSSLAIEVRQALQPRSVMPVETNQIPQPPPASHPLSPLISAETKGLYSDGWTSPVAHLVFHPAVISGAYKISFWLPNSANTKQITLQPASGERQTLEVLPGRRTEYTLAPPGDIMSGVSLQLETEGSVPTGQDSRSLGVVLVHVVWVDQIKEG